VTKEELHFLYELHPKFAAFPTFPINLAFKQTDQDVFDFIARTVSASVPGTPPFDPQRSVDGERSIEILRPIPTSSEGLDLELRGKVIGVYDKGLCSMSTSSPPPRIMKVHGNALYAKRRQSQAAT
jgi:hypothetical protein